MILTDEQIEQFLPHRDRFLLISGARVHGALDDERCRFDESALQAWWDIPEESWVVEGHFPGDPLVPGVLITEAMAQACGLLARCFSPQTRTSPVLLVAIDNARFLHPVRVPVRLDLWPRLQRVRGLIWKFFVRATVDGVEVATCEIMARLVATEETVSTPALVEVAN